MANQPWLDEVRQRLAKQALPASYIQRFVSELCDHLEDLKEENMSTDADVSSRLGQPEHVANAAVTAYQQRSFLGRHPTAAFLVFAVSPAIMQIVVFALTTVGVKAVVMIADRLGIFSDHERYAPPSEIAVTIMSYAFSLVFLIVPTILAGLLYCKLAKRLSIGREWMVVSCIVLAAMAMLPCWYVGIRADTAGHPFVVGGPWIPFYSHGCSDYYSHISELVQLAAPLAIGWWFLRRKHDQNQLHLAS
jgi:hypothetical protein